MVAKLILCVAGSCPILESTTVAVRMTGDRLCGKAATVASMVGDSHHTADAKSDSCVITPVPCLPCASYAQAPNRAVVAG